MDTATSEAPTRMSFAEKVVNLFTSPGELYEDVQQTPNTTSNWLIPLVIFIVVSLIMGQLVMQNPSLADQMGRTIRHQFDSAIEQGKMTPEQADQAYEMAKPGSTWFLIGQTAGVIIAVPIVLFIITLVYWLLGKWGMKATAPYAKVLEVIGFTFLIGAVESIVTTILMFALDSLFATPSLGAFVSNFDLQNKLHLALAKANIFTIWSLAVTSIGLSKIFQRDFPKVLVLVFALWIVWSAFSILTGIRLG